jgi:hypothetical protein
VAQITPSCDLARGPDWLCCCNCHLLSMPAAVTLCNSKRTITQICHLLAVSLNVLVARVHCANQIYQH